MLPASRAAWVPVFIATPTSAWASAGASLVPSPVIATSRPSACSSRISSSLRSGVASARKSSTPASSAIFAAVSRLSPVTITVRMPIARRRSKRLAHALLDGVLEVDDAEHLRVARDGERRAALARDAVDRAVELGRRRAALAARPSAAIASAAPLRSMRAVESTPLIRVCAVKGTKWRRVPARARARAGRTAWRARRSSGPRASRRPARRAAPPRPASASATPGIGMNSDAWRLPSVIVPVLSSSSTSTSPEASTARPESASTLRRTRRSMPAMPIALSSAPIVVGMSATSSAISVVTEMSVSAKSRERAQRHDDDEEDQRQRRRAGC